MNKKQKTTVIIWALLTAILGIAASDKASYGDGWKEPMVLWIAATFVSAAFWWVLAPKQE